MNNIKKISLLPCGISLLKLRKGMDGNFGCSHAVCLGNTEDQVYKFGEDFIVCIVAKNREIKANLEI